MPVSQTTLSLFILLLLMATVEKLGKILFFFQKFLPFVLLSVCLFVRLGCCHFTTSKNTATVFMAKRVKKWVCFCQYEVYNWQYFILHWQYFILHWQNYTYQNDIITVHCHFTTKWAKTQRMCFC